MRFPHLAHRSAAAQKLHSTPQQDRINLISGKGETSSRLPGPFSLFLPGSCPNNRNRCRYRYDEGTRTRALGHRPSDGELGERGVLPACDSLKRRPQSEIVLDLVSLKE